MNWDPTNLPQEVKQFLAERHLATLSIPRQGKSPHVTPVGFTWDDESGLARVITFAHSQKVKLLEALPPARADEVAADEDSPDTDNSDANSIGDGRSLHAGSNGSPLMMVSLCQVDGGRWLTLEGAAQVTADKDRCEEGVRRYAQRYRPPKNRGSDRRVIEIKVSKIKGRTPTV